MRAVSAPKNPRKHAQINFTSSSAYTLGRSPPPAQFGSPLVQGRHVVPTAADDTPCTALASQATAIYCAEARVQASRAPPPSSNRKSHGPPPSSPVPTAAAAAGRHRYSLKKQTVKHRTTTTTTPHSHYQTSLPLRCPFCSARASNLRWQRPSFQDQAQAPGGFRV